MMTAFGTIALEQAVGLERLSPLADVAIGGAFDADLCSCLCLCF